MNILRLVPLGLRVSGRTERGGRTKSRGRKSGSLLQFTVAGIGGFTKIVGFSRS